MGLFDAIVRTVINVATLPVDIVFDVVSLGGVAAGEKISFTEKKLQKIKDEAESD